MLDPTTLGDIVQLSPLTYGLFLGFLLLAGAVQYLLGPKWDWVEGPRAGFARSMHEFLTIIGAYGIGESDPYEYGVTLHISDSEMQGEESPEDVVERKLYQSGFHRNLLACKKYRLRDDGDRQWSDGSWVHRPSLLATMQLHATLYENRDDGGDHTFDIYVHEEYSNVRHPFKHLAGDGQRFGPAKDNIKQRFDRNGIEYTVRETSG